MNLTDVSVEKTLSTTATASSAKVDKYTVRSLRFFLLTQRFISSPKKLLTSWFNGWYLVTWRGDTVKHVTILCSL